MKRVFDVNNQKVIETFDKAMTEDVKKRYIAMGNWNSISVDRFGDIMLREEE